MIKTSALHGVPTNEVTRVNNLHLVLWRTWSFDLYMSGAAAPLTVDTLLMQWRK